MLSLYRARHVYERHAALPVHEPEPRFLHSDGNAVIVFPSNPSYSSTNRRVKALHSDDLGNHIEHGFADFGGWFPYLTPFFVESTHGLRGRQAMRAARCLCPM